MCSCLLDVLLRLVFTGHAVITVFHRFGPARLCYAYVVSLGGSIYIFMLGILAHSFAYILVIRNYPCKQNDIYFSEQSVTFKMTKICNMSDKSNLKKNSIPLLWGYILTPMEGQLYVDT